MSPVLLGLALADVALATVVFLALARPDTVVAWLLGPQHLADFHQRSDGAELTRLRRVAVGVGAAGLVAVFTLSALVGATVAHLR